MTEVKADVSMIKKTVSGKSRRLTAIEGRVDRLEKAA
jgi:hypothetical protein